MFRENRKRMLSILSGLVLLTAAMTMAALQEKTAEKPAAAAVAKPGAAEMDRLKFYLGEWTTSKRTQSQSPIRTAGRTPACTPASSGRAGLADQHVSLSRARGRFRRMVSRDLGRQGKSAQSVCFRE